MSTGFNVETYQLGKQDGINSGTGNVSQEVLDRIQSLENNQLNIANEYYCDFTKAEYIDSYKSTIINTGHGIIPRQYKDTWFDPFDNDDNVDWDKSKNISFYTNMIKLDSPTTNYGEFYTMPISLDPFIGFKFNANVKVPVTENFEGQEELKSGCLWFTKAVDNYGRIWLFRADTYKYEDSQVFLTIYNPDMTIYKEKVIPGATFFGPANVYGSYRFSVAHNSASIVFSEENLCIIGFTMLLAEKNGQVNEVYTHDGNNSSHQKYIVNFIDENGNCAVKYNYLLGMSVYNEYTVNYHGGYHGFVQPFHPCSLSIQKNKILMITELDARYYGYYSWDTNRIGRVVISPTTGLLNDVSIPVTYTHGYSNYYENNTTHYTTRVTRHGSHMFKRGDTSYKFITEYIPYSSYIGMDKIYLAELKINDNSLAFDVDKKYSLVVPTTPTPFVYGFGGANGIYYSEKYNYLYIFSNNTSANILNITRYDVDWSTKTTGTTLTVTLKNPKVKSISMSNTTFWGSDYLNHYNERLKVIEDKDKLSLLYGSKNPLTATQQLNYTSIDFDMEIIQPETQLHVSDGTPNSNIVNFDMIVLSDRNILIYTQGNWNDYNDATAKLNSHLYATVTSTISSKLTFYYSTDTDLSWKVITPGEQKILTGLANDIRIKAVLESNNRYDSSPSISGLYVESWDNGLQESRQSEYYSTQISSIQNEGKAILTADYDLNDGTIDWYISYDGGQNFSKINLNEEFIYTHVQTPDFRIKAVLSVKDNAASLPVVRSYTLKSNHVVLHSDLEEIQVNLMKTNFKIDTLTRASRNGLFKMTTDVFSDENGIDKTKSDYLFYPLLGAVGGNYIVTVPQEINSGFSTLLITTSEILDETEPNSKINYFGSLDGGVTYTPIYPNIKAQLSNTNASKNTLIIKAVFYDDAKLSALGIAWD